MYIVYAPSWQGYTEEKQDDEIAIQVYEARDEEALTRCLKDSRAAHRINENYEWQRRVEENATWQKSASFRSIYKKPG
jgi:hypothetical protein